MEMAANANASAAQVQCMEGRGSQEEGLRQLRQLRQLSLN
uniref:Uncharacterized protein n=1 Tax=Candidozyma auris TaxID=498019 RepID=A0A0L0NWJ1_CANAR